MKEKVGRLEAGPRLKGKFLVDWGTHRGKYKHGKISTQSRDHHRHNAHTVRLSSKPIPVKPYSRYTAQSKQP
jgi:hypothetical protein